MHLSSRLIVAVIMSLAVRTLMAATPAAGDDLMVASTRDHLWIVAKDRQDLWLYHHADAMSGPFLRGQTMLSAKPSAIAAWGDRLWMAFPSLPGSVESHREVFTLQVIYNAAVDLYSVVPEGRLDAVASLPGEGELTGFVGTMRGPVALLWPFQHSAVTVKSGVHSQAAEATLAAPRLLQLQGSKWVDLPIPASIHPPFGESRLVVEPDGQSILLLTVSGQTSDRTVMYRRNAADGSWSETDCAQNLRDIRAMTSVGNQIITALELPDEKTISLGNLRPQSVLPFAKVARPSESFALAGLGDRIQLVEATRNSSILVSEVDPISGQVASRTTLIEQPIGYRLWQVGFLLAVLLASTLLVFLVRPVAQGEISLPAGLVPAGQVPRLCALLIDLLPGVLIMVLLFKVHPEDLIYPPVLTTSLGQAMPYSLVALITAVHSTITELVCDTTLGKSLLGLRVISMDGARPRRSSLLIRNAIKLIVMLVPPLALIVFFNPHMQGMGDLVARTLVAAPRTAAGAGEWPDES